MTNPNPIEPVQGVKPAVESAPAAHDASTERVAPDQAKFSALMATETASAELNLGVPPAQEKELHPLFAQEGGSAQRSGSATDQERKKRQQQETEEVAGLAGRSKGSGTAEAGATASEAITSAPSQRTDSFDSQVRALQDQIARDQEGLTKYGDQIKPSYYPVLRNHLTHIDDHIKIALSKVGIEGKGIAEEPGQKKLHPVKQFISYLTHNHQQLEALSSTVASLEHGGQFSAQQMLALQYKMHTIQQQVELFSALLNKVIESIKTVMNVQV